MLLYGDMHQEPETKNRPHIRAVIFPGRLAFRTLVPRIERFSAQGTVASPYPVAGFSPWTEPLLMLHSNFPTTTRLMSRAILSYFARVRSWQIGRLVSGNSYSSHNNSSTA